MATRSQLIDEFEATLQALNDAQAVVDRLNDRLFELGTQIDALGDSTSISDSTYYSRVFLPTIQSAYADFGDDDEDD